MTVRILGIDPGTAEAGHVTIDGDRKTGAVELIYYGVISTQKDLGGSNEVRNRIDQISGQVGALIHTLQADQIAIEDFTEQGKYVGKTYKEMSWLTENLRLTAKSRFNLEPAIYENAQWKYILTGARRLTKDQVKHYIRHKHPEIALQIEGKPTHVWDAAGIALAHFKHLIEHREELRWDGPPLTD